MNTPSAILACVERTTLLKLLRYQVVLAITAAIEAVNVVLVASLVSYLLTGDMNIALARAAELLAGVGLVSDPTKLTVEFIAYIAAANVVTSVLGILNIFVLSHIAADAGRELSNRILRAYLGASSHCILTVGPNTVTKMLTLETQRVVDNIFQNFAQINARFYTAIVIGGVLVYTSAVAFFIAAGLFFVTYLVLMIIVRPRLGAFGKAISKINASRIKLIEEMTGGYKEIKSLKAEPYFDESLSREHAGYAQMYRNLNLIYNTPRFVIELIVFICLTGLTAYSLYSVADEPSADFSQFLPIFGLASLKLLPIFQQFYTGYAQARAHAPAASVIAEFLKEFDPLKGGEVALTSSHARKQPLPSTALDDALDEISFEALTFRYNENDNGFSFSFDLKKSSINFIVGPSGAGKTTLLEMVSDLRSVESGRLIAGGDSFELATISLASVCTYSTQRSFVLAGSVLENLTLGRVVAQDAVEQAIDHAQLQAFLQALPEGLHTQIGTGQRELSVGQTQRLGLARHLAARRGILILDEPTSNLDQQTADSIFRSLREIAKTMFVICVTHDIDRITPSDHVIHVSNGKAGPQ